MSESSETQLIEETRQLLHMFTTGTKLFTLEDIEEIGGFFRLLDTDRSGTISAAEIEQVNADRGEVLSVEEITDLMREADLNGDGQIDFEEFFRYFCGEERIDLKGKVEEIGKLFRLFDKTGNGWISAVEIKQVLADYGEEMTGEAIDALIKPVGVVGKGRVIFEEFVRVFCSEPKVDAEKIAKLKEIFDSIDKDGNGYISADEFKQVLTENGEIMTDDEIKRAEEEIRMADVDGDGQISFEEFVKML